MIKFYFTLFILTTCFFTQLSAQSQYPVNFQMTNNQMRFDIPEGVTHSEINICGLEKNAKYDYWIDGVMNTFQAKKDCYTLPFLASYTADKDFGLSVGKKNSGANPTTSTKMLSNIGVDNSLIPFELIRNVLIGGDCFDVTNVSQIGNASGIGSFYSGTESIGIESGVIIATGNINNAPGPNDSNSAGSNLPGDVVLQDLIDMATSSVNDATGISFDFTPTTEMIEFEYVFASEEYCEFVNSSYNDVFGFFISGPGISGEFEFGGENIALIPESSDNVAINSVNHLENSEFFIPNSSTCNDVPTNPETIQYDGFTSVLTAYAEVIPCETYHIRLVIGDVSDALYDSAVFLKANSFSATGGAIVEANSPFTGTSSAYEGCENGEFIFSRSEDQDVNETLDIEFFVSPAGTAEVNQDYLPFPTTITIPAGQMTATVPVEIISDDLIEGAESLIIEVPSSCTCDESMVEMTLLDVAPMQIEPTNPTICGTESVNLNANTQGGMGTYEYLWSTGSTQSSIDVPAFGTGSENYSVTVTDECGNQTNATSVVTAVAPPEAVISGEADHCEEDTQTLVDLIVEMTGEGPWELTYRQNGILQTPVVAMTNPHFLSVNGLGDYTLESVSYMDGYCPGTVSGLAQVVESALPTAFISGTGNHCEEDTQTLIDLSVEFTGSGPWEFSYRKNGVLQPTISTTDNPYILSVNGLGDYELEDISFANGYCDGTVSGAAAIVESELPTAFISGTGNFCEEDTDSFIPLTVEFTGEGPWEFSYSKNGIFQAVLTANTSPFTFEVNELGTYTVETVSYLNGLCDGTSAGTAEVIPTVPPTAFLSGTGELCPGQSDTYVYLPVEFTGNGPWEITYSHNGITQTPVTTNENPYFLPANAIGSYQVQSVSYLNGLCDGSPTGFAEITAAVIDIEVEATDAECPDTNTGSIQLTGLNGTAPYNFTWNDLDLTGDNPSDLYSGEYQVTMTDANGCIAETVAFVAQPSRIVVESEKLEGLCDGDKGSIIFTEVQGGTPDYLYSIGENIFTTNPVFERLDGGEYNLVVQDLNGCEWTDKVEIIEPARIELFVEPVATIGLGDSHEIDVQTSIPNWQITDVVWTNVESLDCTDCLDPVASPLSTTSYVIAITTDKGCKKSTSTIVRVDRQDTPVFVPNAFSPDNDGINDRLTVFAKETAVVNVKSMKIMSRWGEAIYADRDVAPNDISRGWDGLHKGKPVDNGVFLWYAEVEYIDGTSEMLSGDVTVLR